MTVAPWEGSYAHCDCLIRDSSILLLFHGTHRYAPAIVVFRFLPQMSFTVIFVDSESCTMSRLSITNLFYISRLSGPKKCFRESLLLRLALDSVGCGLPESLLDVGCGVARFRLESRPWSSACWRPFEIA